MPQHAWNSIKRGQGGTLVSRGDITMGDLTSLLMYTVYVGSGLQMLTYVLFFSRVSFRYF